MAGHTITLTDWELSRLAMHANCQALTYIGHAASSGLFEHETKDMERWKALADKLNQSEPEDTGK